MRGKLFCHGGIKTQRRITPAYAGKTCRDYTLCCRHRDHPRVCGENLDIMSKVFEIEGSPPRMRGKLANLVAVIGGMRITPAYAGKTFTISLRAINI